MPNQPVKTTTEFIFKIDFDLELVLDVNYANCNYDINIFQWEDGNKSIVDDYYDLFGSVESIDQQIKIAETICEAVIFAKQQLSSIK